MSQKLESVILATGLLFHRHAKQITFAEADLSTAVQNSMSA